jgi:hypothetical protein
MNLLAMCFEGNEGYVELSIGGIGRGYRKWVPVSVLADKDFLLSLSDGLEIYFGPAVRSVGGRMGKINVRGSSVCWADLDDTDSLPPALAILPPSGLVSSGGGFHAYWRLAEFCTNIEALEQANQSLGRALDGDNVFNADRMLRVPGSWNRKYTPVRAVALTHLEPDSVYTLEQLGVLGKLPPKTVHKVVTGDLRGFKNDRSARDWNIVRSLLAAGADEGIIHTIFKHNTCGDRYRELGAIKGPLYLSITIKNALKSPLGAASRGKLQAEDNCYWVATSRGKVQVSTFVLEPTLLLQGEDEDSLVCNIQAHGTNHVWEDIVLPRRAFNSVFALNKYLNKAAWIWLGKDGDVRNLLAGLITELQEDGIPRAFSTGVLGRHMIEEDGRVFFVGNEQVLASDGSLWAKPSEAPIMYVDRGREAPNIVLEDRGLGDLDMEALCQLLPKLNTPGCIWPLIGWFMACPMKPALAMAGYRFPILNVTGTRGSGKTTLITQIFHRMLGLQNPRTYNTDTTHFVALSLLGSSNAIPIAFSEYRAALEGGFVRYVLLSYDTGMDARGNANQSTTQYPLVVPFSLDGEDKLEDPAALERMIVITLSPATIEEGSDCWQAMQEMSSVDLPAMALPYIADTLQLDVSSMLHEASLVVSKHFPSTLPDRVRRNLVVTWTGIIAFDSFAESYGCSCYPEDPTEALGHALENVYSTKMGRAPVGADEFIEYVANGAAQSTRRYPWHMEKESGILWFQMAPAYEAYCGHRASQRRAPRSKDSIRTQLSEIDYVTEPAVMSMKGRSVLAYGIKLAHAHDGGLDLPRQFDPKVFTLTMKQ